MVHHRLTQICVWLPSFLFLSEFMYTFILYIFFIKFSLLFFYLLSHLPQPYKPSVYLFLFQSWYEVWRIVLFKVYLVSELTFFVLVWLWHPCQTTEDCFYLSEWYTRSLVQECINGLTWILLQLCFPTFKYKYRRNNF